MKTSGYFAAGHFREDGDALPVYSPFDGTQIALTFRAGKDVLEYCITKAQEARKTLLATPLHLKARWLRKISEGLFTNRDEIAGMISLESGKPMRYALGEVDRSVQTFRVAAEEVLRQPGDYLPIDWTAAGEGKEAWIKYFPAGIIAGISPFNFPLNLSSHKIAPALAAGCPIILKPSSSTPMSALMLADIANDAGLPSGALSVLPMSRELGDLLVTDPRFAILSFTGSPEVGWKMKAHAGKKKTILELGGNAGVIIGESADLSQAVPKCIGGGFAYSGQVCIHTQRIYVHERLFAEFVSAFTLGASKLKYGDPLDSSTEISSMIDEENAIRVENWIRESVKEGARILCGGKRNGAFVEPSVLTNTRKEMKVCAMEVFGPVVVIEPYPEFADALEMMNDSRFGLQAGVFTNNVSEMNAAFRELNVGGVILNDVPGFRVDHMPYGGIKDSGLGREGVRYAMLEMMEPKILVKPY